MAYIIEIKINKKHDIKKWEQLNVEREFYNNSDTVIMDEILTKIKELGRRKAPCEIRWNFIGSLQGHYLSFPNKSLDYTLMSIAKDRIEEESCLVIKTELPILKSLDIVKQQAIHSVKVNILDNDIDSIDIEIVSDITYVNHKIT